MPSEKSREARLRRHARYLGLEVSKDRTRSLNIDHYGGFMVTDARTGVIVAGGKWDLDLDGVEDVIKARREEIEAVRKTAS
jgi:hypothetical protein